MKVGTDGILLGAAVNLDGATRVLDIGTGSGLIALMCAQRTQQTNAMIDAVEIDLNAAQQAASNVLASPWSDRVEVFHLAITDFACDPTKHEQFDRIVCNPPYFSSQIESPNPARRAARSMGSMSRHQLFAEGRHLLKPSGTFTVIVPIETRALTIEAANANDLKVSAETTVRPLPNAETNRCILEFGFSKRSPLNTTLCIETKHHVFSDEFANLTRQFYLRFAPAS